MNNKRGPWTPAEDQTLLNIINSQGPENWVKISDLMESRSPKQCRERYHQNLKPSLNHSPITEQEGILINSLVIQLGKRWAEIARRLPGRSDNAVKNWWNGGANKRKRASRSHHDVERSPQTVQNPGVTLPPPFASHHQYSAHYSCAPTQAPRQLPLPQEFPPRNISNEPFSHSRTQVPQPIHIPAYHHTMQYPQHYTSYQQPLPSPSGISVASHDTPSLIPDQSPIASPVTPVVLPAGHRPIRSYDGHCYRPAPMEPRIEEPQTIRNDSLVQSEPITQKLPPINQLVDRPYEKLSSRGNEDSTMASRSPSATSPNRTKMDVRSILA